MWLQSSFTLPRLWLDGSSCQTAVEASGKVRATMLPDEKYTKIYKLRLNKYEIIEILKFTQHNVYKYKT